MERPTNAAVYGPTNPGSDAPESSGVRRVASIIGLDPEKEAYYRQLHADAWPSVLERIRKSNIRNFSIYTTELDGKRYLISFFEYVGTDYQADMGAIANDPETQCWWRETEPCQVRLPNREPGAQWSEMERVFFLSD